MKRSSLISHTVELLDRFRSGTQPGDLVLKHYYRSRGYLGAKDRRTISDWYFGILRNRSFLELLVTEAFRLTTTRLPEGKVSSISLLAALLVRVVNEDMGPLRPDLAPAWSAAGGEVALDYFLAALVSVGLPDRIRENPVLKIAAEQSMPEFVVAEWSSEYGQEQTELLCRALNQPAPTTIRVNTLRCTREVCREALKQEGVESEPSRLSPVSLILSKRVNVNDLGPFRNGWFEMQDEGSQLLSMLLESVAGQTIVDACAGGGGKTLHLGALLGDKGRIFAIDADERRLAELGPRIARAGLTIVTLLHATRNQKEIADLKDSADAVLVDAPCSGIGTFRRNPGTKTRVVQSWINELAEVQSAVLEQYSRIVKPGGRLVYCTCTLLRNENEERVEEFRSRHAEFSLVDAPVILQRQGIIVESGSPYLRLLPHRSGTDGFFAAVLQRA